MKLLGRVDSGIPTIFDSGVLLLLTREVTAEECAMSIARSRQIYVSQPRGQLCAANLFVWWLCEF